MGIYSDMILQEYSGNEYDNKNFASCMQELSKIGAYYVEIDKMIAAHVDFVLNEMKKCKKEADFKKMINICYNHADDTNKNLNDTYKKFSERPTFNRFKSLVKKFSVKYSNVTMEEKKKWAEVFTQYHKDMIDIVTPYDKKWVDKLFEEVDRCKKLDYENTGKIVDHIAAWYNCLYDYYGYTHNNILYVLYKLDIGFEDTFRYKMIQKIFKK